MESLVNRTRIESGDLDDVSPVENEDENIRNYGAILDSDSKAR